MKSATFSHKNIAFFFSFRGAGREGGCQHVADVDGSVDTGKGKKKQRTPIARFESRQRTISQGRTFGGRIFGEEFWGNNCWRRILGEEFLGKNFGGISLGEELLGRIFWGGIFWGKIFGEEFSGEICSGKNFGEEIWKGSL